jgi:hypothetical protein
MPITCPFPQLNEASDAASGRLSGRAPVQRLPRADAGTRTPDPLLTMEVLYRLSYVGAERAA